MADITLKEFLAGETLVYEGFKRGKVKCEATYRVGVGIFVEKAGKDLGTADVTDDKRAAAFYHNCTRRAQR